MHRSTPENLFPYPVPIPFTYPDAVRWRHGKQDDLFLEVALEPLISSRQYHDVRETRRDKTGPDAMHSAGVYQLSLTQDVQYSTYVAM